MSEAAIFENNGVSWNERFIGADPTESDARNTRRGRLSASQHMPVDSEIAVELPFKDNRDPNSRTEDRNEKFDDRGDIAKTMARKGQVLSHDLENGHRETNDDVESGAVDGDDDARADTKGGREPSNNHLRIHQRHNDGAENAIEKDHKPSNGYSNAQRENDDRPMKEVLSRVCDGCRRSKVACKHRYIITVYEDTVKSKGRPRKRKPPVVEDEQVSVTGGSPVAQNGPPAKRTRRIRFPNERNNSTAAPRITDPTKNATTRQQRHGTSGKCKREEADDNEVEEVQEADISTISPRKPARRGRKPNSERANIPEATETESVSGKKAGKAPARDTVLASPSSSTDPEPSSNGGLASRSFPADNLQAAIQLSRHTTISRELQQRLEDCDTRWRAAIESLQSAKSILDGWVEAWESGS